MMWVPSDNDNLHRYNDTMINPFDIDIPTRYIHPYVANDTYIHLSSLLYHQYLVDKTKDGMKEETNQQLKKITEKRQRMRVNTKRNRGWSAQKKTTKHILTPSGNRGAFRGA